MLRKFQNRITDVVRAIPVPKHFHCDDLHQGDIFAGAMYCIYLFMIIVADNESRSHQYSAVG